MRSLLPKPDSGSGVLLKSAAIRSQGKRGRRGEDGYILLAVVFLTALVLISLAVAAPKIAADIQRDREMELMHRGLQYRRAIQLYYRKFGAYPPNMDALVKTNEIRFLRKRYKDPVTGKDEWKLIHFGENKTPTAMGFFGQPLAGVGGTGTLAGTGPGGVGQNIGNPIGGTSSIGSGGPTFGGAQLPSTTTTPTDPNATTGTNNTSGSTSSSGDSSGSSNSLGSNTASAFGGSNSTNGQTFGGGGIIGVESTSPKVSILEYKKKKHFNEWEFVYDPIADRQTVSSSGSVGQSMGNAGNGGSSGLGGSSSFGNGGIQPTNPGNPNPTNPTNPTPPVQTPQE